MKLVTEGRCLVTVRTINKILPILGADFIVEAQIDGWSCVVKKDEFKEGDYCLYFEVDSFLPANDKRFSFLLKNGTKTDDAGTERIRLRTTKLKGVISQGLALPVTAFWDEFISIVFRTKNDDPISCDEEVSNLLEELETERNGIEEFLNVIKYEKPDEKNGGAGNAKTGGSFPICIPKTDEERLQNVYGKYSTHFADVEFRPSLKLDGSSITIAYFSDPGFFLDKLDDEKITYNDEKSELEREPIPYPYNWGTAQGVVCSRNLVLKYTPESKYWMGVSNNDLMDKLKNYCETYDRQIAIQGELLGPGVNGNWEKMETYDIYVFRIWDITNKCFFDDADFQETCSLLKLKTVPQFDIIKPFEKYKTLEEFKKASNITSINNPIAEGIVYKSINKVLYKDTMQTVHFKMINDLYLLDKHN